MHMVWGYGVLSMDRIYVTHANKMETEGQCLVQAKFSLISLSLWGTFDS